MPSKTLKLVLNGRSIASRPGKLVETRFEKAIGATIRAAFRLQSGRGGDEITVEVGSDDVLEIGLEDGLVLYTTAGRFEEEFLPDKVSRGSGGELIIPRMIGSLRESRGVVGFILESIGIVDVETAAAETISDFIKNRIESVIVGESDALYRVSQLRQVEVVTESELRPVTGNAFDIDKPILLFIHGTASSTRGSFGDLWGNPSDNIWEQLAAAYPEQNIVGFEHHTLGLSPIENTLNLLRLLPQGARLHLVSHSRGGIVGELLCRGQLSDGRVAFDDEDLAFFSKELNRDLSEIIGIVSADHAGGDDKDPYTRQREQLLELNRLFRLKSIEVERFVRVACPARGTTLASGRLDFYLSALLNIVGHIPFLRGNPVYGVIKSLLLTVVKQKARAEQIPGLEAQMPASPTIRMLNNSRGSSLAPLAVIEGDIEPTGIFKKIALLMVDRFYKSEHDLVVNTPSMDGGMARRFGVFAMSLKGEHVNHFSYFSNSDSRMGVAKALEQARPGGFSERIQDPRVIARSLPRGCETGDAPAVFIVPGILGSELAAGDDPVWIDKLDLLWGGFGKLEISNPEVVPVKPLVSGYGALADYLKESYEVIPFAYDWRRSIRVAADKLADEVRAYLTESHQPVRFIAHSMGGLVVRALITWHGDLWDALCRRPGSRVLMLGTPNDGSFSMVRVLLGQEKLIQYLALADMRHSRNELLDIIRKFPGVLELLPRESDKSPDDKTGFFSGTVWNQIQSVSDPDWRPPSRSDLGRADRFWKRLESMPLDSKRVFYIAGQAPATPIGLQVDQTEGRIRIVSTAQGDGRVPWNSGIPDDIRHWFVDAQHGDLANHPPIFKAISEIIESGDTQALSRNKPLVSRAEERAELPEDRVDYLPDEETLSRAALGSTDRTDTPTAHELPPISVAITHGDLCFVDVPVAVGHYSGDDIVSAEAVLDYQLAGRLRSRRELGLYPGGIETHDILVDCSRGGELTGAIVIGLGDVGTLTPGMLTASVRAAVLRYALMVAEDQCSSDSGLKLASLLIGSGSGGITFDNVLNSIIMGVLKANRELAGDSGNLDHTIRSIEFVELFEDRAALAQYRLNQIAGHATYRSCLEVEQQLRHREGGLRRAYALEAEGWWPRIRIKAETGGAMSFTVIDQGARVPMEITPTQRNSIEPFLREATGSIYSADKVGRILFELLIPAEFKHHAPERRDLVLVVDHTSARYPWELMEYPTSEGDRALAGEASVIRQLVMPGANTAARPARGEAVIIGDPNLEASGYPQLPGARQEGEVVAKLFRESRNDSWSNPCVMLHPTGSAIIRELMTRQIQILHIAAHGVVNHEMEAVERDAVPERVTGVLIGKDHVLTAAEINQMPSIPQLAFINCCYLGKVADGGSPKLNQPNLLAADFGVSLIQRGVRAVVVAGWEVQDDAAALFAKTFYTQMFDGRNFGQAVKQARAQTQKAYPQFNTWGAYQCYGDQGFHLVNTSTAEDSDRNGHARFISVRHCIIEIENIAEQAKTTSNQDRLVAALRTLVAALPSDWSGDSRLQAGLGRAWGELGVFESAIRAYEAAARDARPAATISDLEQLANLKARYALELSEAGDRREAKRLLQEAITSLGQLNREHGRTVERLNILASAYKRQSLVFGPVSQSRLRSLTNACRFYQAANEHAMREGNGRPYAYSVINLLSLWYLVRYYGGRYEIDQRTIESWIRGLKENQPDLELNRESFWEDVAGTDLLVLESMLHDSLHSMVDDIASRYDEIRSHASSPRQFGSVMAHFQLMRKIAVQAPDAHLKRNRRALKESRDRLVAALGEIIGRLSA